MHPVVRQEPGDRSGERGRRLKELGGGALGDTGFRWTEEVAIRGKGCVCLRWGQGLRVVFRADGPEQVTKHWPTCTHIFTFHREEYFKEIPGKDKPARF